MLRGDDAVGPEHRVVAAVNGGLGMALAIPGSSPDEVLFVALAILAALAVATALMLRSH